MIIFSFLVPCFFPFFSLSFPFLFPFLNVFLFISSLISYILKLDWHRIDSKPAGGCTPAARSRQHVCEQCYVYDYGRWLLLRGFLCVLRLSSFRLQSYIAFAFTVRVEATQTQKKRPSKGSYIAWNRPIENAGCTLSPSRAAGYFFPLFSSPSTPRQPC